MNLIDSAINRSFGASWEKRLTHDKVMATCKRGELAALLKSLGIGLLDSTDTVQSLMSGVDQIIRLGYATSSERPFLLQCVEDCLLDKQHQDEYDASVTTKQVNLDPGKPLLP